MAFTVKDYHDFIRLLETHPEWRPELRRLVLTDELLELPVAVRELATAQQRTESQLRELAAAQQRTESQLRELAAAQQRTEQRLEQLAQRVDQLAEAQQRTEQRLEQLAQRVDQLAEAQQRTEQRLEQLAQRVDQLAEAQQRTEEQLAALIGRVDALEVQMGKLILEVQNLTTAQRQMVITLGDHTGQLLEMKYRDHAPGYFGRWLRRARAVPLDTVEESLEAVLSREELLEVLNLDLLVKGHLRDRLESPELWLAVEVAAVLNEEDVERARKRADLLRRAGYRAVPLVAGERITLDGEDAARAQKVVVVQDGRGHLWDEALAELEAGATSEQ